MARVHDCGKHPEPANACYVICRCRCYGCATQRSTYERRRQQAHASGRPPMVDAEPVRRHLRSLMASGIGQTDGVGLKRISEVSGVSHGSIWKLLYGKEGGPSRQVRRETAERLLAVTDQDRADRSTVAATDTWRKVQVLLRAGFTKAELGRYLSGDPSTRALQLSKTRVTYAHARRIDQLHRWWVDRQIKPVGRRSRWDTSVPPVEPQFVSRDKVRHLPAGPLLEVIEGRGGIGQVTVHLPDHERAAVKRAYHRARKSGRITEDYADLIALKLLGRLPELIWGDAWLDEEVVA